jgi:8-oxo-dGTP diphosphatase
MSAYSYNFCPNCGKPLTRKLSFGAERPVCSSCGWIYFKDPKVAAAVLVEKDHKVLLVQRNNEPYQGFWSLPAGFVDGGEDPARAAERECLEETGLIVHVDSLLTVLGEKEHPRGSDILIIYRATISGGNLHAGDDAGQAAFFPRQQLPPLAFHSTQKILNEN